MTAIEGKVQAPLATRPRAFVVRNVPIRKSLKTATAEARQIIAEALPRVVLTLAKKAADGDAAHLKLFLELSGVLKGGLAAPPKLIKEKTLEEIFVEQWERDKEQENEQLLKLQQSQQIPKEDA